MTRLFAGIGRFSVRFRWAVLVGWIVVTVFSVKAFPSLASVAKDTTSGFLPQSSASMHATQLAAPFQNTNQATMTLVAASTTGTSLTSSDTAAVAAVQTRIRTMPHVTLVRDFGLSSDRQAEQALVQTDLPPYSQSADAKDLVAAVRAQFPGSGTLQFHLTGSLPTVIDSQSQSGNSRSSIQSLSLLLIVVLLLVAFRALLAPLITLFPALLVLLLSSPVIAGATQIGVQASSITQFILIVLVLGAGTDYGLFLVFRVREELRGGAEPKDAVRTAVSTVGESITFSALTVMAALMSLVVAQFGLYQSLGPALAIGIGLMLLAGLTLLPALLAIFGRAVFWPSRTRPELNPRQTLYGRIAGGVVRHPRVVAAVGLLFFAGLALGQVGAPAAGFADQSSPSGTDSAAGAAVLTAHFGGGGTNSNEVLFTFAQPIYGHATDLVTLESDLHASGQFAAVTGPVEVVQAAGGLPALQQALKDPTSASSAPLLRSLSRFISADGHTVQVQTLFTNSNTSDPRAIAAVPAVRAAVTSVAAQVHATDSGIFGILPFAYDVNAVSSSDLLHILPLVAVLIAILLAIVLRSLIAPLYLVASVVLSYLAAIGITALIFVRLGGQSGINFVLPFLMFVFLMALGSDYNILVMTRIREEAQRLPLLAAIRHAVAVTGTTVTTAGVILGGTFAVLAVAGGSSSGGDQIKQIGYGIAAGVLMDTFLVRTILVPSFVAILGNWNWWPSSLFRNGAAEDPEVTPADAAA
ncbi:MAG TPA: MMPL family transporter [Candidatus Dormibacteraeota bacterium]|nr:MMPL family transporter [Candidatus Dormibacteraeota bacterium]